MKYGLGLGINMSEVLYNSDIQRSNEVYTLVFNLDVQDISRLYYDNGVGAPVRYTPCDTDTKSRVNRITVSINGVDAFLTTPTPANALYLKSNNGKYYLDGSNVQFKYTLASGDLFAVNNMFVVLTAQFLLASTIVVATTEPSTLNVVGKLAANKAIVGVAGNHTWFSLPAVYDKPLVSSLLSRTVNPLGVHNLRVVPTALFPVSTFTPIPPMKCISSYGATYNQVHIYGLQVYSGVNTEAQALAINTKAVEYYGVQV